MKSTLIAKLSLFIALLSCVGYVGYRFFFVAENSVAIEPEPIDQEIILKLPDQEYTVLEHSLDFSTPELIIPGVMEKTNRVSYNATEGVLVAIDPSYDYAVDLEKLKATLSLYPEQETITITPTYRAIQRGEKTLNEFNSRLAKIYRSPLTLSLKDGSANTDLFLDSEILRNILQPRSTSFLSPLEIDKNKLHSWIDARLSPKQKEYFIPDIAYQNIRTAVNARFMDEPTPVVLGLDDGPSSRGELAERYLEVDLSQQKMYFFINGSLYNEYRISTGIDFPTPVGEFHILNKAPKAFSSIYNVWMPYWMGFKYANEVGAYLGLHEIAYALDEKGKPLYRHGYYIGDKMTGGCVAMEPKDSKEIYNLSEVGMLVRIVK